jgi:hypothetical protein
VNTSTIAPGRFFCPVCPKRFVSVGEKKQHLRTEHPKKGSKS